MKLLQSVILFLCASLFSSTLLANEQEQSNNPHEQAIIDILVALEIPDMVRNSMRETMTQNTSEDMTEDYVNCINSNLSDEMLHGVLVPAYQSTFDKNTALRLVEFLNTEAGEKFAVMVQIQAGSDLPMPTMTPEDQKVFTQYETDILHFSDQQLHLDLETAGEDLGMQLGQNCTP